MKMRENGGKSILEKYFEKVFSANENTFQKYFQNNKIK
jgi:hypothetical protein